MILLFNFVVRLPHHRGVPNALLLLLRILQIQLFIRLRQLQRLLVLADIRLTSLVLALFLSEEVFGIIFH